MRITIPAEPHIDIYENDEVTFEEKGNKVEILYQGTTFYVSKNELIRVIQVLSKED